MKIRLDGVIGCEITAADFKKKLPENGEAVEIEINSPGGDVVEAFAVYNAIKSYKGEVTAIVDALAASAAAYLILGADKIKIYANSVIMIHRSWCFTIGNAPKLREDAAILDSLDNIMAADYAVMTGKDKAAALDEMKNDIWLIGADVILAAGIKCEKIDYEKENKDSKIDETQARALYKAMIEKIKSRGGKPTDAKALALIKSSRSKAMTKEELIELLEADEALKTAILEWAKEQAGDKDGAAADAPAPEKEPEKEPPAENKPAAERRRCSEIIALEGGTMTALAKAAIERGTSAADFMVEQAIAAKKTQGAENTGALGNPSAPQTFAALSGKKKDGGPAAPVTDDERLRAMARSI
jgi:ATP-dependent protease ClpP protease subunit